VCGPALCWLRACGRDAGAEQDNGSNRQARQQKQQAGKRRTRQLQANFSVVTTAIFHMPFHFRFVAKKSQISSSSSLEESMRKNMPGLNKIVSDARGVADNGLQDLIASSAQNKRPAAAVNGPPSKKAKVQTRQTYRQKAGSQGKKKQEEASKEDDDQSEQESDKLLQSSEEEEGSGAEEEGSGAEEEGSGAEEEQEQAQEDAVNQECVEAGVSEAGLIITGGHEVDADEQREKERAVHVAVLRGIFDAIVPVSPLPQSPIVQLKFIEERLPSGSRGYWSHTRQSMSSSQMLRYVLLSLLARSDLQVDFLKDVHYHVINSLIGTLPATLIRELCLEVTDVYDQITVPAYAQVYWQRLQEAFGVEFKAIALLELYNHIMDVQQEVQKKAEENNSGVVEQSVAPERPALSKEVSVRHKRHHVSNVIKLKCNHQQYCDKHNIELSDLKMWMAEYGKEYR